VKTTHVLKGVSVWQVRFLTEADWNDWTTALRACRAQYQMRQSKRNSLQLSLRPSRLSEDTIIEQKSLAFSGLDKVSVP
jgi:hypothetical protein